MYRPHEGYHTREKSLREHVVHVRQRSRSRMARLLVKLLHENREARVADKERASEAVKCLWCTHPSFFVTYTDTAELAGYAREVLSADTKSNGSVLLALSDCSIPWLRGKRCPLFGRLYLVHMPRQQDCPSRLGFSIKMG